MDVDVDVKVDLVSDETPSTEYNVRSISFEDSLIDPSFVGCICAVPLTRLAHQSPPHAPHLCQPVDAGDDRYSSHFLDSRISDCLTPFENY